MKFINKKKFIIVVLDTSSETFIIYIVTLNIKKINIAFYSF